MFFSNILMKLYRSMENIYFMNINKILYILFCFFTAYAADISDTLTDAALRKRASELPVARHVVQLEAVIPLPFGFSLTFRTGSAVCIGKGREFLTNAHCMTPWCDKQGRLKYPIYVRKGMNRKRINNLYIHEQYFNKPTKAAYDIAYFSLGASMLGLDGIEPTYLQPSSHNLFGKNLDVVGYGISGNAGAWFGRCDGFKRAVVTPFNSYYSSYPSTITHFSSHFGFTQEYDSESRPISITLVPLIAYQAGFRPGMSGGGVFSDDQYVAISTRHERPPSLHEASPTWRSKIWKALHIRTYLKGLAALGIPVPFLHPTIGIHLECHLVLGPFQEWIEAKRQMNS
jgi:V8-like Glu-specific endopeptidase